MPVLEIDSVSAGYRTLEVLRGVNLAVESGEVVALLGRNGAGKSALMAVVSGLLPLRGGEVKIQSVATSELAPERIANLGLSYMPQGHRIFGSLTVKEHLALAQDSSGGRGWELEKIGKAMPFLVERERQLGRTLSGGERQMLSLARMLASAGVLCLMDEPTEGLSPTVVEGVAKVINELRKEGRAVLMVEHRLPFVNRIADRVAILFGGQIVFSGPVTEFRDDATLRREYLHI